MSFQQFWNPKQSVDHARFVTHFHASFGVSRNRCSSIALTRR